MKKYYNKNLIIASCDIRGNILGPIERWEAHEKGILHRAFTIAVFYKGQLLIQHRKHPVFDGTFDVTSSSHQVYENGRLQDTIEAARECLKREWGISKKDIFNLKDNGTIYYKTKDKFSIYTEHEVCNVVVYKVKSLPKPNFDVSYGYSLLTREELVNPNSRTYQNLAPWVKKMLERNLL
jgi:isopentenyl-diphosphate delta-isomerase